MFRFTKGFVLAAFFATGLAQAEVSVPALEVQKVFQAVQGVLDAQTANAIRWKVGDFHEIKIDFILPGTGRKEATKDEPAQNAVWLKTTMQLLGQNQTTEALINRANGEVLRLIVNGKEEDPKAGGDMEIIEQSETTVTVPAGTFDCFYVKAKVTGQQGTQTIEAWVNPIDVNLDGMLKTKIESQFGPISMILQRFGSR
mgnify:CR=1 FL=1